MSSYHFPANFLWGAATSAYQIEGDPLADGAGASIWHRFAHTPGRVANGDTGDRACGHYRRWAEDVALLAELGMTAYRFSVAWGRVLPDGRGAVNQRGLDFYRRLVDALVERGITPMLTLYHWDLPAALQDRGGWRNPDSPAWFADYAQVLFHALDDRVPLWVTINEPWVVTIPGHVDGELAPGLRDLDAAPRVAHHLLLAHLAAVAAYRASGRHQIGIAVNLEPQHPASAALADQMAAQRRDAFINRWFLDLLLLGSYPPEMAEIFGAAWPEEFTPISNPPNPPFSKGGESSPTTDFIGVNYYSRGLVQAEPTVRPLGARRVSPAAEVPITTMGWEVYPAGLTATLLWLRERYGALPLYITENGAAFADPPAAHGVIDDAQRVDYLRSHLHAAALALAQGVDLRGYFAWSLLDNFEWAHGYAQRFGLVQVDPLTLVRTPKRSASVYRDVIRRGGI
ncbi:beta-glucosidase [Chromatium okenii]|uniref:GH1 family beta-glucosidase n=1 Tax=Chromatium okenii TaxID=61644 RepID=UPI0019082441|nr:GH1 family beta-glucosidase [Chromatium okenii]MBK1640878.1 beta-glucosidase [Chromatium okenii]